MNARLIADNIIKSVCPVPVATPDDQSIAGFIHQLSTEKDVTSLRLLVCIGIDVKNSIASTNSTDSLHNSYISNLRHCLLLAANCTIAPASFPVGLTCRWKFAWALNQIDLEQRKPCIEGDKNGLYARVSLFRDYMYYIVEPNRQHNSGIDIISRAPHDLPKYFSDFTRKHKYTSIKVSRLNHFRYLFVVDVNSLNTIGYADIGRMIDGLGFYMQNVTTDDNYVAIEYDKSFDKDTWQPDSLTGDWGRANYSGCQNGNDFFLSFRHSDRWGRTFSVTGSSLSFRERVHLPFDNGAGSLYNITAVSLGNLPGVLNKCSDKTILKEAIDRYRTA